MPRGRRAPRSRKGRSVLDARTRTRRHGRSQEQLQADIAQVEADSWEGRDLKLIGDRSRKGLWQEWREKVAEDGERSSRSGAAP